MLIFSIDFVQSAATNRGCTFLGRSNSHDPRLLSHKNKKTTVWTSKKSGFDSLQEAQIHIFCLEPRPVGLHVRLYFEFLWSLSDWSKQFNQTLTLHLLYVWRLYLVWNSMTLILGKWTTWCTIFSMYLSLFLSLYMFRAHHAHHQERQIVWIQPLVAVGGPVVFRSPTAHDMATNTEWQLPEDVFTHFVSPDDEHDVFETCREI